MHLEPLVIVANITQGANIHLYHVLTTLGNLYWLFSNPDILGDVQDVVCGNLQKCWAAINEVPFLASIILNPYLHGKCFTWCHISLTQIGLFNMLKNLYIYLFGRDPGPEFHTTFKDYYNDKRELLRENMGLDMWLQESESQLIFHLIILQALLNYLIARAVSSV